MVWLILGLLVFLGAHSVRLFAEDWRVRQIARFGELRWKGVISVASAVGLVLIVMGFGITRAEPVDLWDKPYWTRYLTTGMMLLALIQLVAAYLPGSHIKERIGHPMVAGVVIWSLAHLLANGNLADVVMFGAFLAWADPAAFSNGRWHFPDAARHSVHYISGGSFFATGETFEA